MKWTVKAVPCSIPNRFVLIDKETGEIVDDAQGYGYKTEKKAYACWAYKNRDKELEKKVKKWMKSNKAIMRKIDHLAYDIVKAGYEFGYEDIENLLDEEEIKIDFPVKNLYYLWRRG